MTSTRRTVAVVAALSLSLAACAGESPQTDDDGAAGTGGDGAAGGDVRTLRFGHVYDPDHPNETCGAQGLNDLLQGSGLEVESFPSAQLGTEEEMLEQVADGSLEMSIAGPSFLGVWHEPAAVFDAAYLFSDVDHFEETLNGEVGQQVWDGLREESGLQVLGTWYYGTRHITSNKPIRTPDDLAGVKLRVPNAPLYLDNTAAMGGTATPVALSEVYLALQQGAIDAQENPIPTIETFALHEVQSHLNLTGHIVQGTMVVVGEQTLEGLEPDQQEALTAAVEELSGEVRSCIEGQEQEVLEEWRESEAIEIVEDVDVEAFRQAVLDELPGKYPAWADLYEQIQSQG